MNSTSACKMAPPRASLVGWLNGLPAVKPGQDQLAAPHPRADLSQWKNGGYRDWEQQQMRSTWRAPLRERQGAGPKAERGPLSEVLGLCWARATWWRRAPWPRHRERRAGGSCATMCTDVVKLRRADLQAERLGPGTDARCSGANIRIREGFGQARQDRPKEQDHWEMERCRKVAVGETGRKPGAHLLLGKTPEIGETCDRRRRRQRRGKRTRRTTRSAGVAERRRPGVSGRGAMRKARLGEAAENLDRIRAGGSTAGRAGQPIPGDPGMKSPSDGDAQA